MTGLLRRISPLVALLLLVAFAAPASAQSKYARYIKMNPDELFNQCVNGADDVACYFYGGLQKKRSKLEEAHDAFFLGAQMAKDRAGFVCMLELAQMYEKGQGARRDPVQAYRWYTVLINDQPETDLRSSASNKRRQIAVTMSTDQIAMAEAMAKAWKGQSGS